MSLSASDKEQIVDIINSRLLCAFRWNHEMVDDFIGGELGYIRKDIFEDAIKEQEQSETDLRRIVHDIRAELDSVLNLLFLLADGKKLVATEDDHGRKQIVIVNKEVSA